MMAGMCPMEVPGTTVAADDVEGGIGLSFTTTTGDVAELRRRVRRMAEMHNQPGGHRPGGHGMMGTPGTAAPGAGGGGRGGMMMASGNMMPAATASEVDIETGARLILEPTEPEQLGALREHVRMKAQRMAGGDCPMMSVDGGGEPAPASPHDAHHPEK